VIFVLVFLLKKIENFNLWAQNATKGLHNYEKCALLDFDSIDVDILVPHPKTCLFQILIHLFSSSGKCMDFHELIINTFKILITFQPLRNVLED